LRILHSSFGISVHGGRSGWMEGFDGSRCGAQGNRLSGQAAAFWLGPGYRFRLHHGWSVNGFGKDPSFPGWT
jgi:hypothetical protein